MHTSYDTIAQAYPVDSARLDQARLGRLREQLRNRGCAGGLFYDPTNIRYATGVSNMQVYSLHNPCRYVFVPVQGPVVLFDFKGCAHLSKDSTVVSEVRNAVSWYHFVSGNRVDEMVQLWAAQIADLVTTHGAGERRLCVDRIDPPGVAALASHGIAVIDGQEPINMARLVKTPDEINALYQAVRVCEQGFEAMDRVRQPGITEVALWAELHKANIALGGEWIETRLLSSGPRTNPWYHEAGMRKIEVGDMVACDSDLIGPLGYSADISRAWRMGDGLPTDAQRRLYAMAYRQMHTNLQLFTAGSSFREISEKAFALPEPYLQRQNGCIAHGIGLCNEYPLVVHQKGYAASGIDGPVEEGMVFCVESFVGDPAGGEGVKLEEQILVTAQGPVAMSVYPYQLHWL